MQLQRSAENFLRTTHYFQRALKTVIHILQQLRYQLLLTYCGD